MRLWGGGGGSIDEGGQRRGWRGTGAEVMGESKVSSLVASGRVLRPKAPLGLWFRICLRKTK